MSVHLNDNDSEAPLAPLKSELSSWQANNATTISAQGANTNRNTDQARKFRVRSTSQQALIASKQKLSRKRSASAEDLKVTEEEPSAQALQQSATSPCSSQPPTPTRLQHSPVFTRRSLPGNPNESTELSSLKKGGIRQHLSRSFDGISFTGQRLGQKFKSKGFFPHSPVLLVPGFCSVTLRIEHSEDMPQWEKKRAWLSLRRFGFWGSLTFKRSNSLKSITSPIASPRSSTTSPSSPVNFSASTPTIPRRKDADESTTPPQQAEDDNDLDEDIESDTAGAEETDGHWQRNAWLRHIILKSDGHSDPDGIRVRPEKGLEAVDYVDPGMLTSPLSYVFGPLIQQLRDVGYTESNLCAAPYDWRIPPSQLEARDHFFTNMIAQIEKMSRDNFDHPVVIVAHSMGNRCVQYFLEFAKQKCGQPWIDQYIHTFVAVSAPFLGVPKALRIIISGDKMGLDAFLTDQEALMVGRHMGSVPWLLPIWNVSHWNHLPSLVYTRAEGLINLRLGRFTFWSESQQQQHPHHQHHRSPSSSSSFSSPDTPEFKRSSSSSSSISALGSTTLAAFIEISASGYSLRTSFSSRKHDQMTWDQWFHYVSVNPYSLSSADTITLTLKEKSLTPFSGSVMATATLDLSQTLLDSNTFSGTVLFYRRRFSEDQSMEEMILGEVNVDVEWVPPSKKETYIAREMVEMMQLEGADISLQQHNDFYVNDPLYNTVLHPPPCKLFVINGYNLDTEMFFFYRRRIYQDNTKMQSRFKLDSKGKMEGFRCRRGIAYETKDKAANGRSGDGIVPYCSLSFWQHWVGQENAKEIIHKDIEGAEHRGILSNRYFHRLILQYVCTDGEQNDFQEPTTD